jgi:opacity protein-like surface antigen
MKKSFSLLLIMMLASGIAAAQDKVVPNKPYSILNTYAGYITINEVTGGFGIGETDVPVAKGFTGFTTIHGYQVNKNFLVAGGTGVYFYNEATFIPLFADFRYSFMIGTLTPFVFGDGGFLLDIENLNSGTRLFVNAGPGVRYAMSNKLALNLGAGLFIQMGDQRRDSYINFKLGVTFKPN